jgi:hypothetical protein
MREAFGMRAGTMSAVLYGLEESKSAERTFAVEGKESAQPKVFSADRFAGEQIRGLVRRVFMSGLTPPVHQIVLGAIENGIDVAGICGKVGETLAAETDKEVVVVTSGPRSDFFLESEPMAPARTAAMQVDKNLWSVHLPNDRRHIPAHSLQRYMAKIRREFEYSIVAASAGDPHEALAMGLAGDGVILVLSAMRTRRAEAVRFRDALAQLRLLGTVLTDREFPIPAAIYRRL